MALTVLFEHPRYRAYALGSLASLIGTWAQRVALGWMVWESTASIAWVGVLAVADAIPIALLGVLGGALSDRGTPLRLARFTTGASAACTLALCAVALIEAPPLGLILALVLVNGIATALGQPARMVLAPSLVPRSVIPAAVAFGSLSFNIARLIGPAAGGALIAHLGLAAAIGFNALTYVGFLIVLFRLPPATGTPGTGRPKGRQDGGAPRFALLREPALGYPLLVTAIVSLAVRGHIELMPAVTGALLDEGAGALALLLACAGLGAILGGMWMLSEQSDSKLHRRMMFAGAGAALVLVGLAASAHIILTAALVATCAGLLLISATAAQSLLQLHAPEGARGRLIGIYLALLRAGPALGALALGFLGDQIGLRFALAIGAGLGLVGLLGLASREWVRLVRAGPPQTRARTEIERR